MARLQDVLKKLNKGKKEDDIIMLASKQPEDYFVKNTTSIGSPYLDMMTNGGYTKGGFNLIIADGGVGKSSIALIAIRKEFEETGRIGVYLDGEGTLDESYMARMGVTKDMIYYVKGRSLEDMLDTAEAFSTADEVGTIIIDSIPIFVSAVVEAKSAAENNMAVEARKYTARMPIIEGNCMRRDSTLIGLTSYKLDPGAMGDPRKLPRGQWQYTMANLILELTKKDILKDENGEEIGHVIDCRIKKSKIASYNPKEVHKVNFYYDCGFNEFDEYTSIFIVNGMIKQGGAWFSFADTEGEEIKLNGKAQVIDYLKDNEEVFNVLMERLNG
ncbi:MAG: RecA/RadA recombinase [Sulfurimonas sp.]|jgi:RecA/RadA recombinase|uniref:hypothetical protein n=1 Tax=Sulfurimonas sp. TaxID=2022749 RepID=UPI0039E6BE02